ncbi:hypothetical protein Mal64_26140 [Pseudobythopirellula maris]|uniref:SPW repeat protein n=1 Tax=Pseudobythopirellula maris TaxID=2527991 RepID=A0A5C5ZNP2_9BACT|nr:hypothetical protein Mal64_26140 [Pseudobythopirellula maris]
MAEGKSRHGCLTAWLVLMIIANSASALMYLVGSDAIRRSLPDAPGWAFPVLIVFSLFNLVCAIALFQWKKWGFWGFCLSSVVALVVNLSIGLGIGPAVGGLIGLVLLYGVLHIGKENKGWPQLE